ncbi:MAG: hypothetical protein ACRC80_24990, partial [Waterburya sp.]
MATISPLGYTNLSTISKNYIGAPTPDTARSLTNSRIEHTANNNFVIDHLLHTFPSTTVPQGSLGLIRSLTG